MTHDRHSMPRRRLHRRVRRRPTPTARSALEVLGMTKRFGALAALDDVSLKVPPGTFHALLGENGAGKSTLVKCIMGYLPGRRRAASLIEEQRARDRTSARTAHALGLGMVYQHFTSCRDMTVARTSSWRATALPAVIDWRKEKSELAAFLERMPFRVPLDAQGVGDLAPARSRSCEILKQLYLQRHFLILDEPTSVLTPQEADEVLGMVRGLCTQGELTRPDDHPQVPRGDGVLRRGDGPAPRPARRRGARSRDLTPAGRWPG